MAVHFLLRRLKYFVDGDIFYIDNSDYRNSEHGLHQNEFDNRLT